MAHVQTLVKYEDSSMPLYSGPRSPAHAGPQRRVRAAMFITRTFRERYTDIEWAAVLKAFALQGWRVPST